MTKRSERSRWVTVYFFGIADETSSSRWFADKHREMAAIVRAFQKVGRVVRIEVDHSTIALKARRA